jgi:hypothetical protein
MRSERPEVLLKIEDLVLDIFAFKQSHDIILNILLDGNVVRILDRRLYNIA